MCAIDFQVITAALVFITRYKKTNHNSSVSDSRRTDRAHFAGYRMFDLRRVTYRGVGNNTIWYIEDIKWRVHPNESRAPEQRPSPKRAPAENRICLFRFISLPHDIHFFGNIYATLKKTQIPIKTRYIFI